MLLILSIFTSSILEKCQENNKCIKGQRRTNRPFQAFITFAVGYSRGAWAAVLTFGLFLHHVESHTVVAPNNVRGKDPGAVPFCLLLPCRGRDRVMIHISRLPLTAQSIVYAPEVATNTTVSALDYFFIQFGAEVRKCHGFLFSSMHLKKLK